MQIGAAATPTDDETGVDAGTLLLALTGDAELAVLVGDEGAAEDAAGVDECAGWAGADPAQAVIQRASAMATVTVDPPIPRRGN